MHWACLLHKLLENFDYLDKLEELEARLLGEWVSVISSSFVVLLTEGESRGGEGEIESPLVVHGIWLDTELSGEALRKRKVSWKN